MPYATWYIVFCIVISARGVTRVCKLHRPPIGINNVDRRVDMTNKTTEKERVYIYGRTRLIYPVRPEKNRFSRITYHTPHAWKHTWHDFRSWLPYTWIKRKKAHAPPSDHTPPHMSTPGQYSCLVFQPPIYHLREVVPCCPVDSLEYCLRLR